MPSPLAVLVLATSALVSGVSAQDGAHWEPRVGDRVVLMGSALAERMQHHGWLEARLTCRAPELELSFRNLGFASDALTVQQRTAGFGSWDDWLERTGADVVFGCFGTIESFGGVEQLPAFRANLADFIDHLDTLTTADGGPPRLVLFSPVPVEDLGNPLLPDAGSENARLGAYADAMADVARQRGVPYLDLFAPMSARLAQADVLTINGLHLTDAGNRELAEIAEAALLAERPASSVDELRLTRVRDAVLEKNLAWFNRYRATDGYNVYGGRSSLAYTDGVTNFTVLQRELEVLDAMCDVLDRKIHALARGESVPERPSVAEGWLPPAHAEGAATQPGVDVPPLMDVVTNRPGPSDDGSHPYRDGEQAMAAMTLADGLEVSLFADETRFPALANPVQMAFDPAGRLWVAAWPTYPHWAPGQHMNDKLLIIEDTDGDGRADRCEPFADDLHNPTGFEFWNGGVFVANPPDLLFLKDTDGDGKADVRERVLHGFSSADTHHSINSFVHGPDGAFYFQEGTFHMSQVESIWGPMRNLNACVWRFEPRTGRVERYIPYNFANPHGHVFDRWGQDFMTDGTGNVNYYALPFSGHIEHPDKHAGYFPFFQQRSRPAAATELITGDHFPESMQGNYLIANVIGFQGIFQYEVVDAGSGFGAHEVEPIVFSSDPFFRPVDMEIGPDGALWVLDWQQALIGHMQHHLRDPSRDHAHGRIYRITAAGRDLLHPAPIAGRPVDELLELLADGDDRVRSRVRLELSARDSADVVRMARQWAMTTDDEHDLLEALWTQQQHAVLDVELLERLLEAEDPRARAAATRVLRQMRREVERPLQWLRRLVVDEHPRVRLEAVVACSFLGSAEAAEIALLALDQPTDPFLDYAIQETVRALEPHWRPAMASGAAFAIDDIAGLTYALQRLDADELASVRPSTSLYREMLGRHGLARDDYLRAAAGMAEALAMQHGTDPRANAAGAGFGSVLAGAVADELLAAIERADARQGGHVDHLLSGLFDALAGLPRTARPTLAQPLRRLSTDARRASTRRLATVARLRAEGTIEPAWAEAEASLGAMLDLLDAASLLDDPALAEALFPRVLDLLDQLPPAIAAEVEGQTGTRGRYVRVELPGDERTLTLAEVEVLSAGVNVARAGTATQSSINWGGLPERAIDGKTSGRWADSEQTHTMEDQPNPWWELDLGSEQAIDAIVLYNRTDSPDLASRLDGALVRVLDAGRRTTWQHQTGAAVERTALVLSAPDVALRRAALRCVAALGVRRTEAVRALAPRFADPELRHAVASALAGVPAERWPEDVRDHLGRLMLEHFVQAADAGHWATDGGRQLLALADTLGPTLADSDLAARLATARGRLGPQVVLIRPVPDALLYDRVEFTVRAGRPVELLFENVDIMPHNLVVTAPGALATVGLAGEAMAAEPDAWERAFVPDLDEVLVATGLLQPGESETLTFTAPETAGDHPYVCTFPGHWVRMNGSMHVVASWEEAEAAADTGAPMATGGDRAGHGGREAHAEAAGSANPAPRRFVQRWQLADLLPHLDGVDDAEVATGRAVFEAASCQRCHKVGTEGGVTGPELGATVAKYTRDELLTQLLQPSRVIAEGYESELVFTTDGKVLAGRVLAEDELAIHVQTDPYSDATVEVPLALIDVRRTSEVSTMPDGLLTTFERDEILALVAYLESLAPDGD